VVEEFLKKHHIGKRTAAELCRVNYRTFCRWAEDKPSMPMAAWELLNIKIDSQDSNSNIP
jgi:hypothetical protein